MSTWDSSKTLPVLVVGTIYVSFFVILPALVIYLFFRILEALEIVSFDTLTDIEKTKSTDGKEAKQE
jgi:hypothetical protein